MDPRPLALAAAGLLRGYKATSHWLTRDALKAGYQAQLLMAGDLDMVDIVHRRAPHPPVIPGEAHRLDQVHPRAQAGPEPQHRTDVARDLGLEQGDADRAFLCHHSRPLFHTTRPITSTSSRGNSIGR